MPQEVILPLYSTLMKHHLHAALGLPEAMTCERGSREGPQNMVRGIEHLSYEHCLRELDRRAWRREGSEETLLWPYLKGAYMINEEKLSRQACSDRTFKRQWCWPEGRFK